MATILKPPDSLPKQWTQPSVFLAGSIDRGAATDWQADFEAALADTDALILNPRRDAWDASWTQTIDNPLFRAQVEWELEAQENAGVIAMYFAPQSQAPITLLELGLFARTGKLIVCCPDGYWRKGNVEVAATRYGIPTVATLGSLIEQTRRRLSALPSPAQ